MAEFHGVARGFREEAIAKPTAITGPPFGSATQQRPRYANFETPTCQGSRGSCARLGGAGVTRLVPRTIHDPHARGAVYLINAEHHDGWSFSIIATWIETETQPHRSAGGFGDLHREGDLIGIEG